MHFSPRQVDIEPPDQIRKSALVDRLKRDGLLVFVFTMLALIVLYGAIITSR
jgi:hypothetical protein